MNSAFQPLEWSYHSNIYEVNTRQYTSEGTFKAFSDHLPRLFAMGVQILWFMPITPISPLKRLGTLGSYYACSDYTTVNPEFGSLKDFKNLVDQAHQLGQKVIIDWVANHTGWDHQWTKEHPAFYRRNHDGNFFDAHGWEDVIDLNYDNKDLRQSMIEAMRFWIRECDIDGFRCDMAMLVPLDFWIQARTDLDSEKKLFWLAECEDSAYYQAFDAVYTWKFLHKMEAFAKAETDIAGLQEVLQYYEKAFPPTTFRCFFTSNHDENSHSGSEYERLGYRALIFAVLCCMWNGIPIIYSGQEMPNHKRLAFFDKDVIQWTSDFQLHDFYSSLLSIRTNCPAMRANYVAMPVKIVAEEVEGLFAFLRMDESGMSQVWVILNLSGNEIHLKIEDERFVGFYIDGFEKSVIDMALNKSFSLAAWSFKIFVK